MLAKQAGLKSCIKIIQALSSRGPVAPEPNTLETPICWNGKKAIYSLIEDCYTHAITCICYTYLYIRTCRSDCSVMFVFEHRAHIGVIWVHRSKMCHLRTVCTGMSGVLRFVTQAGGPTDFHLRSSKELDHSECIMAAPMWTIGAST